MLKQRTLTVGSCGISGWSDDTVVVDEDDGFCDVVPVFCSFEAPSVGKLFDWIKISFRVLKSLE